MKYKGRDIPIELDSFEPLKRVIENHVRKVVIKSCYVIPIAADILNVPRSSLYKMIKKYGIELPNREK